MNSEMKTFCNELKKIDNYGVEFTLYNGKLISSEEAYKVKLPTGYSIKDNTIFYNDKKIGEFEVYKEKDEIVFNLEELRDDKESKEKEDKNQDNKDISFDSLLKELNYEVETVDGNPMLITDCALEDCTLDEIMEKYNIIMNKFDELKKAHPEFKEVIDKKIYMLEVKNDVAYTPSLDNESNQKRVYSSYIISHISLYRKMIDKIEASSKNVENNKEEKKEVIEEPKSKDKEKDNIIISEDLFGDDEKDELTNKNKKIKVKNKRRNVFKKFVHSIGYGLGSFFGTFGKRNEIAVDDDIIDDSFIEDNDNRTEENTSTTNNTHENVGTDNNTQENTSTYENTKTSEEDESYKAAYNVLKDIDNLMNETEIIIRENNLESFYDSIIKNINYDFDRLSTLLSDGKSVNSLELHMLYNNVLYLKQDVEQRVTNKKTKNM